jgi:hypothetical protein
MLAVPPQLETLQPTTILAAPKHALRQPPAKLTGMEIDSLPHSEINPNVLCILGFF